jgi:plastocyanin
MSLRSTHRALVLLAAAGLLTLAACGQAAGTPSASAAGQQMPDMPMSSAAPAQAAPVTTDTIAIKEFAFTPANVTVKVGTTITWTNADEDPHTVMSSGTGGPLKSQTLNTGESYRYTFTQAGHYDYLCSIHPFMTATVEVTP